MSLHEVQTQAPDPTAMIRLMEQADILRPMAIRVAAGLRLVDLLSENPATAGDLAAQTGTSAPHLEKLLNYLVDQGLFEVDEAGRHTPTEAAAPLHSDHPFSVRRVLDVHGGVGRSQLGLVGLLHTIRTGETCHQSVFGRRYWDDLNSGPEFRDGLREDGNRAPGFGADEIYFGYDWSTRGSVLDVGGNNGMVLIGLLQTHEHLTGASLDLPVLASIAQEEIENAGLTDRARGIAGSFFEELPTGYDVYLLSGILNDWTDDEAVTILRNVARAAAGAPILLAEINLHYTMLSADVSQLELYMSTLVPSPVRSVDDLTALAERAGLRATFSRDENPLRTLVELRPQDAS